MSLPPAIKKFFKAISALFLDLWNWLSSIFDEDKKPAYLVNTTYWLKIEQRVTTLLNEAYRLLDTFFSPEAQAIEQDPRYYQKINSMLEKLSAFARGEVPALETESILENEQDTHLLEAFRKTQEAHFILSLVAEMNIEGLDEVYPSGEEKPEDWVTFEKLFKDIRKKTKIKREIFAADFVDDGTESIDDKSNSEYRFVIFGVAPDGRCIDYCLNMWNRKETIEKIVQCLIDPSIAKFRREYLKSDILCWFGEKSRDGELTQWRNQRKTAHIKRKELEEYQRDLLKQYQFKFTSEQPEGNEIETKKIYVWVKDRALHYIFRNEDKEIIRKNITGIYVDFTYCQGYDEGSVKLLEKEGASFKDIENKVSRFVKIFLKEGVLLSRENMKKMTQAKLNIRASSEAIETKAKALTDYDNDENFAKFLQNNLTNTTWWLNDGIARHLFSILIENAEAKNLTVWNRTSNNKLCIATGEKDFPISSCRLHYLGIGIHANRIVEIDNFPQLITGKRYENRFKICQTAEKHRSYMSDWVYNYRPKNG